MMRPRFLARTWGLALACQEEMVFSGYTGYERFIKTGGAGLRARHRWRPGPAAPPDMVMSRHFLSPAGGFREQQRFIAWARELVRLPAPGEGALDYLLPEAQWRELLARAPDPESWLMALSQATGVYFFPSREFVRRLLRYLQWLGVKRVMEAGAGRGYLSAVLAGLCAARGIAFLAVDRGQGEFASGLPVHPTVQRGDVFTSIQDFRPQVVIFAWPPPGQSLAAICQAPFLHYLIVIGESGTGVTGAREDWEQLPHKVSAALSRGGWGRTGGDYHAVTVFYGAAAR
jgi:hypothetical protein